MIISKIYILESQSFLLSSNMTGKRQVTINSVWLDKAPAQKYVQKMKELQCLSSNPTVFKLKELKPNLIRDIQINCCNDSVSLSVSFTYDSVSQYGEFRKDAYYTMQVAVGHEEPTKFSFNKKYLVINGSEIMGFNYTKPNKEELVEGRTISENFTATYKSWREQGAKV